MYVCLSVTVSVCSIPTSPDVIAAIIVIMYVIWVVKPCGLMVDTSVSDEHTASVFRTEERWCPLQVYTALQPKKTIIDFLLYACLSVGLFCIYLLKPVSLSAVVVKNKVFSR